MSRALLWSRGWLAALLLGGAGLACGAPDNGVCGQVGCGAVRVDPAAIRAALHEADSEAPGGRPGERRAAPVAANAAAPAASTVWDRRLGGPGAREDYNCALSFGVGGALGGDGFLATRALGRTRIWRGE
jgi:hypothetical protein